MSDIIGGNPAHVVEIFVVLGILALLNKDSVAFDCITFSEYRNRFKFLFLDILNLAFPTFVPNQYVSAADEIFSTGTPLWRNGPPEKPVLCNACGSRWRTKGTLTNYTPLHARIDAIDYEDYRAPRAKTFSLKKRDGKPPKRKLSYENIVIGEFNPDHNHRFQMNIDDDTSNRSSSGSAISNSESSAQFSGADASDLTGPAQSVVWDTLVPSKKRTCVSRPKPNSVEKLTKDLYTILHEQQSSHLSACSEEELLFETDTPMVSVEIGHGSVLIRHPSSMAREEESEASSLSVDIKPCTANEAYSHKGFLLPYSGRTSEFFRYEMEKDEMCTRKMEQVSRDKLHGETGQILFSHDSPLCNVDLADVLNAEVFSGCLTTDEQQVLSKYLSSVDTATLPDSLESMFASVSFTENMSSIQQLLAEGVFDSSWPGIKSEDCKTLKRLALSNPTRSKWVEKYTILKDNKFKDLMGQQMAADAIPSLSSNGEKLHGQNQASPGLKTTMKIPKRVFMKACYEAKENTENDDSCFSPRSLFALPKSGSSVMLGPFHSADESSDQDLLLDVPSNGSFPQAELLSGLVLQQTSTSSSSIHSTLIRP